MLSTWFLSMLISNTATAAMMIPVVNAILVQVTSSKYTTNSDDATENRYEESALANLNVDDRSGKIISLHDLWHMIVTKCI